MNERVALISVFNKEGVVKFAKDLLALGGWRIIASGGTAKVLADAGISAQDIAEIVGGGAILGHRVLTLSRELHAGILARDLSEDRKELAARDIPWIDLVCVDLYPLDEEIRREGSTPESVLEKTDIGGPALLRSAAKGRRIVICEVDQRKSVINWLKNGEPARERFLTELAAHAEFAVAGYCLASANYTQRQT